MRFNNLTSLICTRTLSIVTECYLQKVVSVCTWRQWTESWYILVMFHGIKSHWLCRGNDSKLVINLTSNFFFGGGEGGILVSCVFYVLWYSPLSHAYFSNAIWKTITTNNFKPLHSV